MNISVIGTNQIGLSTAILMAYLGHFVIVVDDNQPKLQLLKSNSLHYYEPYLNDALKVVNSSIIYTTNLTSAIEQSDIVYFTDDVGYNLFEVSHIFAETLKNKFKLLINKSSAQPGTTVKISELIRSKSTNFSIVYESPNADTTSIVMDTFYPEKIILGVDNQVSCYTLEDLYKPIIDRHIILPDFITTPHRKNGSLIVTDINSAEISFHIEKVFKGMKASFINEINNICDKYEANTNEIIKILKTTGINSLETKYGLGWSKKEFGENFEILTESAQKHNLEVPLIEAALRSNYSQRDSLVHKLSDAMGGLSNKNIGILGLTYKPYTDDITDSPGIDIIRILLEHGAKIKAHDPVANFKSSMKFPELHVDYFDSYYDFFKDLDIVVICTEWPEYFDLDWFELGQTMKKPRIFDARHCLSKKDFTSMGYVFYSL